MRKRSLKSCKRGAVTDTLAVLVFGVLLSFTLFIIGGVVFTIDDGVQSSNLDQVGKDHFSNFRNVYVPVFDTGFFVLMMGLIIGGVTGLFIIESHPVLAVASWIALGIMVFIGAVFANAFSDFANTPGTISSWLDEFTFIPLVMGHFVEFLIIVGLIFMIALYAKVNT